MTKRNPAVYLNYSSKRPQYPFRVPKEQRDEVEELRAQLGLGKQEFMTKVFELGYPMLKNLLTS